MKLTYIGDYPREFPGVGIFTPEQRIERDEETAKTLLKTGLFRLDDEETLSKKQGGKN